MAHPHYTEAPVSGADLRGGFTFTDGKKLTREQEARLANRLNTEILMAKAAIWFNPETDRSKDGAKVFGEPLTLDGEPVRYALPDEGAIFPARSRDAA